MLTAEENAGANYMYPNEGNIFVASEFEIVNNSDADIAISSMLCFTAYCDDYAVDQSYTGATLYSDKGTLGWHCSAGQATEWRYCVRGAARLGKAGDRLHAFGLGRPQLDFLELTNAG